MAALAVGRDRRLELLDCRSENEVLAGADLGYGRLDVPRERLILRLEVEQRHLHRRLERLVIVAIARLSARVAVILAEPVNEFAHAYLDRRRRAVADIAHQIVDVGERLGHIAGLQRQHVLLRLAPDAFLDDLDIA